MINQVFSLLIALLNTVLEMDWVNNLAYQNVQSSLDLLGMILDYDEDDEDYDEDDEDYDED